MLKIISFIFLLHSSLAFSFQCRDYLSLGKTKSCSDTQFFSFSDKRCTHYQTQRNATEDKQIQIFIDHVLQCLIQETHSSSCDELWDKNVTDHKLCFKRHGYCRMNLSQEWELFILTGFPSDQAAHYFKIFWHILLMC